MASGDLYPFKCKDCPEKFKLIKEAKEHFLKAHDESNQKNEKQVLYKGKYLIKQKTFKCPMEHLFLKVPHLCDQILDLLDEKSLVTFRKKSQVWALYQRLYLYRRIKETIENYHNSGKAWQTVINNANIEVIDELKVAVTKFYGKPNFMLHFDFMKACDLSYELDTCKEIDTEIECMNIGMCNGITPLHVAAGTGSLAILKVFEKMFGESHPKDEFGRIPLHYAAQNGCYITCSYMLAKLDDKNVKDNAGLSLLHFAALDGKLTLYKLFVEDFVELIPKSLLGTKSNPKSLLGYTPLHFAARNGHFKLFQFIFEKEEDKNPISNVNFTPLHYAASGGHLKIFEFVKGKIVEGLNSFYDSAYTPLHCAAFKGQLEVCIYLIDNNVYPNPKKILVPGGASIYDGPTPLYLAARKGCLKVCKIFLSLLNDEMTKNDFLLRAAAISGNLEIYKMILGDKKNANPNTGCFGLTPLHKAAQFGHLEICKFIVERVDEKNPSDDNGVTPAILAQRNNHIQIAVLIQLALLQKSRPPITPQLPGECQNHQSNKSCKECRVTPQKVGQDSGPKRDLEVSPTQEETNDTPSSKKRKSRWS